MKKNRIKFTKKLKYYLKGYDVTSIREYYKNDKRDHNPLESFPVDTFILSNHTNDNISIVNSSGNVILPEGTYEILFSSKDIFVVLDKTSNNIYIYTMAGDIKESCEVKCPSDVTILPSFIRFSSKSIIKEENIIVKDEETNLYTIFNEKGEAVEKDIVSYTTYLGSEGLVIFALYKSDKTYLMLNHDEFIPIDCVIELDSFSLPISCGILNKNNKTGEFITEKYFITSDGNFINIPFKKIEYAGDKICWRVEDFNGKHNYMMPSGRVLLKEWMQDITRFHNGYAFVRKDQNDFYDLINCHGEIIPRDNKFKIRSIETGFRNVFYNGEKMILAMVNVRETCYEGKDVVYKDYQCFVDRNYNFYHIGKN